MAFPLVTPDDLISFLRRLEPHVRIDLADSQLRRKPSPLKEDRVVVITAEALRLS